MDSECGFSFCIEVIGRYSSRRVCTALASCPTQVAQLVRIANHVQRPNGVTFDFERGRLDGSLWCIDDHTGLAT